MTASLIKIYRRIIAGAALLTAELLLTIILFSVAFAAFIFITKTIFWDKSHDFDTLAFTYLSAYISPKNNSIMLFITSLGNFQFLLIANILLTAYFLFIRKHRWYSIKIPSIAMSSVIVMLLLKSVFNRSRPLVPLLQPAVGLSFPSGHALSSVTFYGLLIYFVWQKKMNNTLRVPVIILLILLILSIGISRIYLRVHFASDVVGGYCAGIIWLIVSIHVIDRIESYVKRNLIK